jgi:hypothetical protein
VAAVVTFPDPSLAVDDSQRTKSSSLARETRRWQNAPMPLTDKERAELLKRLDDVCHEARELQERLKRQMHANARRDMPDPGQQPEGRVRPSRTR